MVVYGCVEEIPVEVQLQSSISIEDILVVEATITDELKAQEIFLSRGNSFANDSIISVEQAAEVIITNELGTSFRFMEQEPGRYVSETPFAAQSGVTYQLFITTSSGISYQSEASQVTGNSNIDAIYAERVISDNEVEGMAIFVDSSNPIGELNDYRYTYAETYKIIAPNWTPVEFEVIREQTEIIVDPVTNEILEVLFPDVTLVPREEEEQTCFNTVLSNEIILSDGVVLNSNNIEGNLVRFINRNDPIISHRYSILVKQFLQSVEAAKFYRTLLQFSQNESLFSEVQPGFLEGNISAIDNTEALVIGFFSVASVAERRLFFDYEDFFPGEPLPPFFNGANCSTPFSPPLGDPNKDGPSSLEECGGQRPLIDYLESEEIEFFLSNSNPPPLCEGPFFVTQRICGDCTVLGSNIEPEFWID